MRIFTLDDFVKGKIPSRDSFVPALNQFEEDCVIPYLSEEVYGAFAYGSVNRDDCNVASDIDYFMIITDDSHKKKVRKATKRAYEESNVDIETRVTHINHARTGLHNLDASFRQHLELSVAKYGFKGKNPLEVLVPNDVSFKDALKKSMIYYLIKLDNGYTNYPISEEEYSSLLKTIMEKPFHAMRVAIQHKHGTVAPDGVENFSDTKQELMNIYSKMDVDPALIKDLHLIRSTAGEYIRLLESRLAGKIPEDFFEDVHNEMLNSIENCYPIAYKFISENAKLMVE